MGLAHQSQLPYAGMTRIRFKGYFSATSRRHPRFYQGRESAHMRNMVQ